MYGPPGYYPVQNGAPSNSSNTIWIGIGVVAVLALAYYFIIYKPANDSSAIYNGALPQIGQVIDSNGVQVVNQVPVQPTVQAPVLVTPIVPASSGQTASNNLPGPSAGQSFTPPADNSTINVPVSPPAPVVIAVPVPVAPPAPVVDPLAGIKFIRLYKELNYGGEDTLVLPGMRVELIKRVGNAWEFQWKSMKVVQGVKLTLSRYTGGGRTTRAFLNGLYDVKNLQALIMSNPALSSQYNIDSGQALERADNFGTDSTFISVETDANWASSQQKSYSGCISTIEAWNRSSPGKYQTAYCDNVTVGAVSGYYTLSI
jgi:hypothetical protein